jgi:hypothetical protein
MQPDSRKSLLATPGNHRLQQSASNAATTMFAFHVHVQDHGSARRPLTKKARPWADNDSTSAQDFAVRVHGKKSTIRAIGHRIRKIFASRIIRPLQRGLITTAHVPPHHAAMANQSVDIGGNGGANGEFRHSSFFSGGQKKVKY